MGTVGIAVAAVGGLGVLLNLIAWRRMRRASKVLDAAMKLHDGYMEKLNANLKRLEDGNA